MSYNKINEIYTTSIDEVLDLDNEPIYKYTDNTTDDNNKTDNTTFMDIPDPDKIKGKYIRNSFKSKYKEFNLDNNFEQKIPQKQINQQQINQPQYKQPQYKQQNQKPQEIQQYQIPYQTPQEIQQYQIPYQTPQEMQQYQIPYQTPQEIQHLLPHQTTYDQYDQYDKYDQYDQYDKYNSSYKDNQLPYNYYNTKLNSPYCCLDVSSHIENCPICSKFYNTDKTIYIITIVILIIICFILLKKIIYK